METQLSTEKNCIERPHSADANSFAAMTVGAIIPCYNEEATIDKVVADLQAAVPNIQIHIFDNNSTDNSAKIARSLPDFGKSVFLHSVELQGKGNVVSRAFSILREFDALVMIDADSQYDVSVLPLALDKFFADEIDMMNITRKVVNSRVHRKGHGFGNALFSHLASALFSQKIDDMLSGFRIFSRNFVRAFPAHSTGFEIKTELSVFALQQRMKIATIDAPYFSRPQGSFSKLSTFKDGFKILRMLFSLLISERPLLAFGGFSALCLALGVVLGIPIVRDFLRTGKVARFPTLFAVVGLGVVAVISAFSGIICASSPAPSRKTAALRLKEIWEEKNEKIFVFVFCGSRNFNFCRILFARRGLFNSVAILAGGDDGIRRSFQE